MDGLRRGLLVLHDHTQPIEARWNLARAAAKHFGHATLSAVLHILYPRECGVWNGISEAGLKRLNVGPQLSNDASEGERYRKINDCLLELAKSLNVDLWDLDALMWRIKEYETIMLQEDVLPQFTHLSPSKKEVLREIWQRNSKEVAWIKSKYSHRCQICGSVPFNGDLGSDISEAHHIVWLSRYGADCRDNMILLCPNHHAAMHMSDPPPEFDREKLSFTFAENNVITLRLDLHLRKTT